ncbi:MAG: ATPase, T2SS/T4P/T4SS family [Candidatus Calescibacterium sp.]|nr:ATPase, T2SS/T4P/T4SS family [Candidatus Calescibacterium sp.]MDW8132128.1 ATPase, T2SS/T4P/T4SS family [Candidatus Calescibacterium sp.]
MNILDKILTMVFQQNAESLFLIEDVPPFLKYKDQRTKNIIDDKIDREKIDEILKIFINEKERLELRKNGYWVGNYTTSTGLPFRAIVFYQKSKLAVIFFPSTVESIKLESLELPPQYVDALNKNKGLIIIAGPKKSGKTTIFNSSIEYILENRDVLLATVEDFIEKEFYKSRGIVYQFVVGKDYSTIRDVLSVIRRLKPDVVAIQEIINYEYLEIALDLSLSGLLVICTINADGIISVFEKISGMSGDQKQNVFRYLSMVLEIVISGNLFTTTDGNLKYVYDFYFNDPEFVKFLSQADINEVYLRMVEKREKGYRVQEYTLRALVKKGLIKEEEALLKASRVNDFKRILASPY